VSEDTRRGKSGR